MRQTIQTGLTMRAGNGAEKGWLLTDDGMRVPAKVTRTLTIAGTKVHSVSHTDPYVSPPSGETPVVSEAPPAAQVRAEGARDLLAITGHTTLDACIKSLMEGQHTLPKDQLRLYAEVAAWYLANKLEKPEGAYAGPSGAAGLAHPRLQATLQERLATERPRRLPFLRRTGKTGGETATITYHRRNRMGRLAASVALSTVVLSGGLAAWSKVGVMVSDRYQAAEADFNASIGGDHLGYIEPENRPAFEKYMQRPGLDNTLLRGVNKIWEADDTLENGVITWGAKHGLADELEALAPYADAGWKDKKLNELSEITNLPIYDKTGNASVGEFTPKDKLVWHLEALGPNGDARGAPSTDGYWILTAHERLDLASTVGSLSLPPLKDRSINYETTADLGLNPRLVPLASPDALPQVPLIKVSGDAMLGIADMLGQEQFRQVITHDGSPILDATPLSVLEGADIRAVRANLYDLKDGKLLRTLEPQVQQDDTGTFWLSFPKKDDEVDKGRVALEYWIQPHAGTGRPAAAVHPMTVSSSLEKINYDRTLKTTMGGDLAMLQKLIMGSHYHKDPSAQELAKYIAGNKSYSWRPYAEAGAPRNLVVKDTHLALFAVARLAATMKSLECSPAANLLVISNPQTKQEGALDVRVGYLHASDPKRSDVISQHEAHMFVGTQKPIRRRDGTVTHVIDPTPEDTRNIAQHPKGFDPNQSPDKVVAESIGRAAAALGMLVLVGAAANIERKNIQLFRQIVRATPGSGPRPLSKRAAAAQERDRQLAAVAQWVQFAAPGASLNVLSSEKLPEALLGEGRQDFTLDPDKLQALIAERREHGALLVDDELVRDIFALQRRRINAAKLKNHDVVTA